MNKPELILPAGTLYKAKIAYMYGADACYGGLAKHSLRKAEVVFDFDDLKEAVSLAHSLNKKFYVTVNIFAHNEDIGVITQDIKKLEEIGPDGIIASDPGVISHILKNTQIPVHISTQANTTNWLSAKHWYEQGVKRIVLARELELKEIEEINRKVPELELEAFVHGAMCISYSGRCLMSAVMTGRKANLGDCAQPCRWQYKGYLEEKMRPGEFFPVEEDDRGTYIFNSKDLRLIEHLPKMAQAGVSSFKIEGRNKSEYYVATIARAYRKAIDLIGDKDYDQKIKELVLETEAINYRDYTTGFIFGDAKDGEVFPERVQIRKYNLLGVIEGYEGRLARVPVRNNFKVGDEVEILTPDKVYTENVIKILDKNKKNVEVVSPGTKEHIAYLEFTNKYPELSMLRKKLK
jgi:U32 family peptidase